MADKRIYILTGPIQSGKTTKLLQWAANRKDVFGILTPVVNGKRFFLDAHTKEQFQMEAESGEENILSIGRFIFSKDAFEKAVEILQKATKGKDGWLIIDEIGPLELRREGFSEVTKEILQERSIPNLIFVMRESVVQQAIDFFKLNKREIIILKTDYEFFSR